jgi:ATP-binding cassette subfamily C protein
VGRHAFGGNRMKLLLDFTRAHPWHSLLMLLCLLVAAAAQAVGFSALLPLISALAGPGSLDGAAASEPDGLEAHAIAALRAAGLEPTLETLLVVVPAVFVLRAGLILLARREIGYTVARVARELRLRLIRALLATSWSYFVEQRVGTFANAYSTETTRAARGYLNATWVVMYALQIVVYVGIALAISWKVTLFTTGIGVVLVAVLGPLVRVGRKAGIKQTKLFRNVLGSLTDIFQGVKPLKAMAREDRVAPLLEDGTRALERATRRQIVSREAMAALQEPIVVCMLCVGLFTMHRLGFNIASMTVMTLVVAQTLDGLNRAQRRYLRVAVQESAYRSLTQTIAAAESARESVCAGGVPACLERAVELESVAFAYGDVALFEDLSLEIPAGRITALTGASGAGKTTVVDLVVGLVKPQAGVITLDGTPLDQVDLADWRAHIGYVPQEMFLLHDTVAMNVGLGDPTVSRDDIIDALKIAHAWGFVSEMADGIDTVVGERGLALSGGQRQRIAIARAMLKKPRLLILDEATAALDPASEVAVWETVRELRGKTTVLAISHQSALVDVADRIYAVEASSARTVEVPERPGPDGESSARAEPEPAARVHGSIPAR